jgi:hypothetical protein
VAGAVVLVVWAVAMWAAVGVLAYASRARAPRRPVPLWVFRASACVIVLGVIGQIGHIQEHFAQVGYWAAHPNAQPWMTPWGAALARGLEQVDRSKPTFGMEFLHLTGNFIFLAGIAGVMVITRHARASRARKWARMGMWMQGIHGLEHLSLTLSVVFGANRAIGLSTWFGLIDPGPALWTYRVWWHFIANVVGSVIFGIALFRLWRERAAVRAAYATAPLPAVAGEQPATA